VGLVASLVFLLVERLWRRLGGARWCASPRAAALACMTAALAYALLAGFQVPAQRALVMIWASAACILFTGRIRPWPVFGISLWLVLLLDPLSVLTAGFWLSFGAVGLILYLSRARYGRKSRLQRLLGVQFGLVTGLTPLLWIWFQRASLTAPLANLVAIPWVGLLTVPLLLIALALLALWPPAAEILLRIAGHSLDGLWRVLHLLDLGAVTTWWAPPLTLAALLVVCAGLLTLLLPPATGLRPAALLMLLPVMATRPARPAAGDLWMTLLDVGQGLAVVVETRRHLLVYDTGPAFPGGFDSGTSVLVPFLHQRGYHRVDRLVISHGDNDHSGGGASLYASLPVFSVHSGEPPAIGWAYTKSCRRQPPWHWDSVRFEYLQTPRARGNNASCVLKITPADGRAVLLPGDIEHPVENHLLAADRRALAARVLVAPHHGSRTSSGAAFIRAVDPEWVLFANGYRNRFGFPRPEIVARYRVAGVRRQSTAAGGAIAVSIEQGKPLQVEAWRSRHRRLWRHLD
jgi:competence protein ComEC